MIHRVCFAVECGDLFELSRGKSADATFLFFFFFMLSVRRAFSMTKETSSPGCDLKCKLSDEYEKSLTMSSTIDGNCSVAHSSTYLVPPPPLK